MRCLRWGTGGEAAAAAAASAARISGAWKAPAPVEAWGRGPAAGRGGIGAFRSTRAGAGDGGSAAVAWGAVDALAALLLLRDMIFTLLLIL